MWLHCNGDVQEAEVDLGIIRNSSSQPLRIGRCELLGLITCTRG